MAAGTPSQTRPTPARLLPELWRILRYFSPHLRSHRMLASGALVAVLAEVVLRLLEPWPLKFIFDRLLHPAISVAAGDTEAPAQQSVWVWLTLCAVSTVVITSLRALASYWSTIGFAIVGNRVMADVRAQVYRHLQRLSLSFHGAARNGDLLVRVIGDVGMLRDVMVTAVMPLMANVLILLGMLAFMFWLHWELAMLTLVTVPLFWISTVRITRGIRDAARRQRQRESNMASTAGESLGSIKTVQAYSLQETFSKEFSSQNKKSLRDSVQTSRLAARLERTTDVLTAVATALVLFHGTRLVLSEELTPGDLIVFLRYLQNAFRPVRDFAKYTGRLAKAAAAGDRILDLLDRTPDVRDTPGAVAAPPLTGAVRLENVSFFYEPGRPALRDVNLDIRPGQRVALIGPSGAGKSTIANLILRLYEPTGGKVLADGRDIRDFTLASYRAQISIVLQDSLLFAASIKENIAYGTYGAYGAPGAAAGRNGNDVAASVSSDDGLMPEIEAAARLANADHFIRELPEGYDTVIGERGVTLSGGQRQRIAIARAAVRKAPVLVLDEPTAGLDEENAAAVLDALHRAADGRTTFYITHDMRLATKADLVVYLESGRIVAQGTHHELMRASSRYSALFRLQAAGTEEGPDPELSEGSHALA